MRFAQRLIAWQKEAGRHDLPWQQSRDPYRVWLSEIMLQQTQVATVIGYYERFLAHFPDVRALAAAPLDAVIQQWAGLGYYARARNLHRCARQVVDQHSGQFPADPAVLAELPGIGRSTAAAIAAFAFGRRAAILDGNVKRVFCRHFGIEGFPGQASVDRVLWQLAEEQLPARDIEAYTQGLMDLGATVCTRRRPQCGACPLQASCVAARDARQDELPSPRPRKVLPERRATFLLISDGKNLLLERRPQAGIWGGLLVPPEGSPETVLPALGLDLQAINALAVLPHTFTHFRLLIEPLLCQVRPKDVVGPAPLQWIPLATAADAGVPTPMRKLIRQVTSAAG